MTTTARTPRVLLVAGACVVVAVLVAALLGGLSTGSAGALGALVGGSIACVFFLFGSFVVNAATRIAPQAAMVMALMTYTLQVALVALVFAVLADSGAIGTTLSSGWVAGGVIAATVAWVAGQLVASARARIPAYDIDLPGSTGGSSQTSSEAKEAGAR
ncbi:MAG: putative synthase protein [Marmoricola sp.]|nr:putative synthase protein [Marmoricola sp.]